MDLRKLSDKQLKALIAKAQKRQSQIASKRVGAVRAKVVALLKAEGFSVSEVFGATPGKRGPGRPPKAAKARRKVRRGYKVKPKYRNPENPSQTWAGRGLRPKWFRAALAGGRKEKDLLIKG